MIYSSATKHLKICILDIYCASYDIYNIFCASYGIYFNNKLCVLCIPGYVLYLMIYTVHLAIYTIYTGHLTIYVSKTKLCVVYPMVYSSVNIIPPIT